MKKINLSFLMLFFYLTIKCQPVNLPCGVTDWGSQGNIYLSKTALAIDAFGNKWVGYTSLGVSRFNGTSWVLYNVANGSLPSDSVTCVIARSNLIFVGTKNGIARYNGSTWSIINTSNSQLISNKINTLFFKNNILWVGTNAGVSKFDGTTWTNYTTSNSSICSNNVQAIEQTSNNDLWFGTSNGLSRLSGNNWTNFDTLNSGLKDNNIRALISDKTNRLFIGTENKGIFILQSNTIKSILFLYPKLKEYIYDDNHTEILQKKILDFAKDLDGNIYCYGYAKGLTNNFDKNLLKITPTNCKVYTTKINPIYMECSGNNVLWFVNTDIQGISHSQNLYSVAFAETCERDDFEILDHNNISAGISSSGFLFNTAGIKMMSSMFNAPKGSDCSTIYCGNLWLGAKNTTTGQLHVSAETYKDKGRDYQCGPVSNDTLLYTLERNKWNKVWKVSKKDISYHRTHFHLSSYKMPEYIATWPGNGNPNYGQAQLLAPYVDFNNNGIYDPQNGDYPKIRGEQALYFIYNDDKTHTESQGNKLKVEIHGMAYVFNLMIDTTLRNTIFVNYRIYNRSAVNYDSLYIGSFTDFDIGYGFDDYIGCDTTRSMYYGYNSINIDGNGQYYTYGASPPAQGVTLLNKPMTSFIYYNNLPNGIYVDPYNPEDYYNYMKGLWKDSTNIYVGGLGHISDVNSTSVKTKYAFFGDPINNSEWSEVKLNNLPGDRRGVAGSGPFYFPANGSICIDFAYNFARNISPYSSNISAVNFLKSEITSIRNFYNNNIVNDCSDLFSLTEFMTEQKEAEILVYPNPANDILNLYIENTDLLSNTLVEIYDIQGKQVQQTIVNNYYSTIDISYLRKGFYIVKVTGNNYVKTSKFIKE